MKKQIHKGVSYDIYHIALFSYVVEAHVGEKRYISYVDIRMDWTGEKTNTKCDIRCFISHQLSEFINEGTPEKYKNASRIICEVLSHGKGDENEVYYDREFELVAMSPCVHQRIRLPKNPSHYKENWDEPILEAIRITIAYAVAVDIEVSLLNRMGYVEKVMRRLSKKRQEKMGYVKMAVYGSKLLALLSGANIALGDGDADVDFDIQANLPDVPNVPNVDISFGNGTPVAVLDYSEAALIPNLSGGLYSEIGVQDLMDSMFMDDMEVWAHVIELQNNGGVESGESAVSQATGLPSFTGTEHLPTNIDSEPDMSYYDGNIDNYSKKLEQATEDVVKADSPEKLDEAIKRQKEMKDHLNYWKDAWDSTYNEEKLSHIHSDYIINMANHSSNSLKDCIAELDKRLASSN